MSDAIQFKNATASAGLAEYSPTFGAAVVDIDNDGQEDLIISTHNTPPSLYLNQNGVFVDRSNLLPQRVLSDWHGITAVDLDNDGDKDLIIAGGGADGVGPGEVNRLFRNMLSETKTLAFKNATPSVGIAYRPWRTRAFLPLASPDGSRVDLYMVGLEREGCPNLYFSNRSVQNIVLAADPTLGLNEISGSEGLDLFFDYDRDGDPDFIHLRHFRPAFYERRKDGYAKVETMFPDLGGIYHVAAGDLNNDGYPDLFLSAFPPPSASDNISWSGQEIHFVIQKQANDLSDDFLFDAAGPSIEIDFSQHTPGNPVTGTSDIFIGRAKTNPPSRRTTLTTEEAEGPPAIDGPGTYVWFDPPANRWHVEWSYGKNPGPYKGRVMASALGRVEPIGFETLPPPRIEDLVLINQKGKGFKKLETVRLVNDQCTRSAAIVDLNNDGLPDIVGLRGSEQGRYNGDLSILVNRGGLKFDFQTIRQGREAEIYQADQLVYGFFNDDGLPDIFCTNGNGLNPGNVGPYQLLLNATPARNDYVLLKLTGKSANRDAIGAEVELYSPEGVLLGYRQVGMGFNRDQSSLKVHFGLGQTNAAKLKARIRWPGASSWDEREVVKNRTNEIVQ